MPRTPRVWVFVSDALRFSQVKSDLEALDGLSSSSKTASLKPFLRDASLLLNLSAKAVRPFVFMHNVFRFGHFDVKPANLLFTRKAA